MTEKLPYGFEMYKKEIEAHLRGIRIDLEKVAIEIDMHFPEIESKNISGYKESKDVLEKYSNAVSNEIKNLKIKILP